MVSSIVTGYGPSFDGYNLSNGFHPLWMILLLPIYYLTDNNTELALQLIFTLQVILGVFTYWFCWVYVSRVLSPYYGVLSLVILIVFASPILILFNGLESGLLLFWLFAILLIDYRYQLYNNASSANVIITGILFGLLFITRLDTAYIIIAFAILKLVDKKSLVSYAAHVYGLLLRYYPAIIIFSLISAPYFIWNYSVFGHLTPISGQIKSSFPYLHLNFNLHAGALPYTLTFLFANLWILVELLFFRSRQGTFLKRHSALVGVYWLGSLIHFIWSSLFMQCAVFQWHFTAYIPLLVLFSVHVIEVILAKYKIAGFKFSAAVIVPVLSILYTLIVYIDKGDHLSLRILANVNTHSGSW